MKTTRNLFLLSGERETVKYVLEKLSFKGLVTASLGTMVDNNYLDRAFGRNKSVVCYARNYVMDYDIQRTVQGRRIHRIIVSKTYQPIKQFIFVGSEEPVEKQFARVVSFLGCEIGDLKTNTADTHEDSSVVGTCDYCDYLRGVFIGSKRLIYRSKLFVILATVGQFEHGQLLVIPIRHIMSNAELTDEEMAEFKEVLEDAEYLIKITYSRPSILVWENGSGRSGANKAKDSIVHAHVHVYPSKLTAEEVAKTSGLTFENISLEDVRKYAEDPYLLMRSERNHDVWKICPTNDVFVPRQYIRAYVAEKAGIKDDSWNWRKYPFYGKIQETVIQIRMAVSKNWNSAPERIKQNMVFFE